MTEPALTSVAAQAARDWIRRAVDTTTTSPLIKCVPSPRSTPPPPLPPLVKDPGNFLCALERLRANNDAIMFWNRTKTLKFMLRSDSTLDSDQEMYFDMSITYDSSEDPDDVLGDILALEHEGYFESETMFVVDEFSVLRNATESSEDLLAAMNKVNGVYDTIICPCSKYLIKDRSTTCITCVMTGARDGFQRVFCPICHDDECLQMHMVMQQCCRQRVCSTCIRSWKNTTDDSKCPLCRQ